MYFKFIRTFCLTVLISFGLYSNAQTVETITSNGTWTVPSGVTTITIECWGGGGGGGGARGYDVYGSGGGGGAYSRSTVSVTVGQIYNITVGVGGTRGAYTGNGGTGGTSQVLNPSSVVVCSALGGVGGNRSSTTATDAQGGNAASGVGDVKFSGGLGRRRSNCSGGGGGGAGTASNGVNADWYEGGNGGASLGGNGGDGQCWWGAGDNGAVRGGGGGGGADDNDGGYYGGTGGRGEVRITYTISSYLAEYQSMSVGSSNWCVGETRNISVTIKNVGTVAWIDGGGEDFNVGVKWNGELDYITRVDAQNLAAGATATFNFTVTAPAVAGADNLTFNVVREGVAWFGGAYVSSAITIFEYPTITGNNSLCAVGETSQLSAGWSAPTGGTITTIGNDRVHSFTSNGTFTTAQAITANILVVGGGGGGGTGGGGGGGGGRVVSLTSQSISGPTHAITIGAGGNGGTGSSNGANGGTTTFTGVTSATGGNGGVANGGAGGSSASGNAGGAGNVGTAPDNPSNADCWRTGGGGGGDALTGTAASHTYVLGTYSSIAGNGRNGTNNNLRTGTNVMYGSGGAGATAQPSGSTCGNMAGTAVLTYGTAASGAGAVNASGAGNNATANRGGGGGGAITGTTGGKGGSGIVVIRYTVPFTWTSSNTAVATINSHTGLVTAVGNGTTTITCTSIYGCESTVTVTVNGPIADAGGALTAICQGATSAAMGGSVSGSATGGTWSGGSGSWTNATNPATATYTAGASETGTITLTLTTSGGSCGTTTATKNITINGPTANAGGALAAICQGVQSADMGGSVGGSATGGTWSGGAGSWSNATNPSTARYTAGSGESGSITLTLTTSGGACGTTTATKNITVNVGPTASAGSALTSICQGATTPAMGGSVGGGATGGTWSGGSGTWTNANNPATATYTAAAGEGGTITLTLTTSGGSCGTTTATKNLTLPTVGTNISGSSSATCVVKDNNWIHFYNGSGLLIGAINSGGVNLGNVTMNVSVGGAGTMDACNETPVNPLYTTAYMGRAWVVTSSVYSGTNFPSSVQIRLPFNGSELTAMNTVATSTTTGNPNDNGATVGNIMLTKFTGGTENFTPSDNCSGGITRGVTQSGNGVVTTTYPGLSAASGASYVEFAVGQFSEMFLHKNFTASPLPVKLIDFNASCTENTVHLNWSTSSEQNSQDFVVERSRDLNVWQEVEILPAAGNSSQNSDYFSTDGEAFQGTTYYRLRQRDLNGGEEIFGPIAATCGNATNSIQVFPNPTQGSFTVEIHSENSESGVGIQLTSMTGQVIETRSINLEAGTNQVNFHNKLESGIYLIRVLDEKASFKTLKLEVRN